MNIKKLTDKELVLLRCDIGKEIKARGISGSRAYDLRHTFVCIDCGVEIKRRSKRCRSCHAKAHDSTANLKSFKGKQNPRWVNGRRSYRKLVELKECEECASKNKLEVHHIDQNRENNTKNNLKVLCVKCHRAKHPNKLFRNKQGMWCKNEINT